MNFQVAIINGHGGMLYGYAKLLGLSITGRLAGLSYNLFWTSLCIFLERSLNIYVSKLNLLPIEVESLMPLAN